MLGLAEPWAAHDGGHEPGEVGQDDCARVEARPYATGGLVSSETGRLLSARRHRSLVAGWLARMIRVRGRPAASSGGATMMSARCCAMCIENRLMSYTLRLPQVDTTMTNRPVAKDSDRQGDQAALANPSPGSR